jgi:hypothetical protein
MRVKGACCGRLLGNDSQRAVAAFERAGPRAAMQSTPAPHARIRGRHLTRHERTSFEAAADPRMPGCRHEPWNRRTPSQLLSHAREGSQCDRATVAGREPAPVAGSCRFATVRASPRGETWESSSWSSFGEWLRETLALLSKSWNAGSRPTWQRRAVETRAQAESSDFPRLTRSRLGRRGDPSSAFSLARRDRRWSRFRCQSKKPSGMKAARTKTGASWVCVDAIPIRTRGPRSTPSLTAASA